MIGPLYSIVMAFHVLVAVIGFGALGATGRYASALRQSGEDGPSRATLRYFRQGRNWAARAIVLVPILGGVLLWLGHGQDVDTSYPWIGLALWLVATVVASSVMWPAERRIQQLISAGTETRERAVPSELGVAAVRCERGAALTTLLFVAALVVMIVQP